MKLLWPDFDVVVRPEIEPAPRRAPHHRWARYGSSCIALTLACSALAPSIASASRIDDLRAEARRIAAQIAANGDRVAALGEQYDGVLLRLDQIRAQQRGAARQLADSQAKTALRRASVKALASQMYMSGSAESSQAALAQTVIDVGERDTYSQAKASKDQAILDGYRIAQGDVRRRQLTLNRSERAARAERDRLRAARLQIDAANSNEEQLLAKVNGELGVLIRDEQRRQARAAQAAARARAAVDAARAAAARTAPSAGGSPGSPVGGRLPKVSGSVGRVIAYAQAQIGKSYVFATAGPDTFDCSGLTMMAWAQAGVSMPHYSGAQYAMFPHVPLERIQPGDLVFWGPGGSQHVALYVGGGMVIAATHTGSFVLLQPFDYATSIGAARP
jgi:cell wall-associated NlpC family hydrolase